MRADTATLAIDVGATRTRIALFGHGAITTRTDMPTPELAPRGTGLSDGLVRAAHELLANAGEGSEQVAIGAVGVSLAASVDEDGNVVQERDFGIPAGGVLRDELAKAFEVPVAVNNDANLAALAEHDLRGKGDELGNSSPEGVKEVRRVRGHAPREDHDLWVHDGADGGDDERPSFERTLAKRPEERVGERLRGEDSSA